MRVTTKLLAAASALFLFSGSAFGGNVVAWGYNSYGQISGVPNSTNVVAIASGMSHCLALNADGTAVAWGWNYFGQTNVPDFIPGKGFINGFIVNIAAGDYHSMALLRDAEVAAWGDNGNGQSSVPGNLYSVVAISGSTADSLALRSDGTVAKWGCSGTCSMPGDLTNIVDIADGQNYSLALRGDGRIEAWGYNNFGQTDVPSDLSNVVAVAAGNYEPMALKADGTVVVWGSVNTYGQSDIPPGLSNVVAIDTGNGQCLALRTDGSVVAWGYFYAGGGGMPESLSNAVAIAAGGVSMAIQSDGTPRFIYGRPGISMLPKRNFSGGESVLLHASAVGAGQLAYFWKQNGTNVATTSSPNLTLTNLLGSSSGQYTVIASNAQGFVESSAVTLSVDPMIVFTNQPGNATVYEAANANFSVTVGGSGPFNYQWRFNAADLPNQTNATLALIQVATNQAGAYSVLISNPYGSAISSSATLTVQLPVLTTQATNRTVFAGDPATFKVLANGALLSYQWLFNGTNLPGATSNVLTLSLVDTNSAGPYFAQVSNPYRTLSTSNATLTIVPITASVSPASAGVYVGDGATFSAVVQKNGPFTYQWRSNGVDMLDQTNSTLVMSGLTTNQSGNYSVVAANPYGMIESAPGTLTVIDSAPGIISGPFNRFTWIGDTVSFSVSANGSKPLSYQWSLNGVPLPNRTNSSIALGVVGTNQVGTYSVVVSNILGATSNSATLTLEPVVAWGLNSAGQAFVNNLPLTNAIAVSAGYTYNLALKSDGKVYSWGSVSMLPAANSNFVAVAAGYSQSLGLRSNGTVIAWGSGTLLVAPASLTNAASIHIAKSSLSFFMTCFAIRSNSTLVGWNNYAFSTLTNIPPGLIGVVGVAAGLYHALALKSDGTITAWQDYSDYGFNAPPAGISNANSFIAIAAGYSHSLALKTNGTVVAWGYNGYGQTNVPAGLTNVVAIAAGGYHSLALKSDGTFVGWGQNTYGQINPSAAYNNLIAISGGDGHTIAINGASDPGIARQPQSATALIHQPLLLSVGVVSKTPIAFQWRLNGAEISGATNSFYRVASLGAGDTGGYTVVISNVTAVVTSSVAQINITGNAVIAWGLNTSGQTNVPAGLNPIAISGGDMHSLALRSDGTVAAWGTVNSGVTNVPANATNIIAISAGYTHNVVLSASRKVIAWGSMTTPPANFTNFLAVSSGYNYSLGLSSGIVAVWGGSAPPASVSNAIAISAGYSQAWALQPDGNLVNWPSGPNAPAGLSNVVTLASGNGFNLALKTDGKVTAWGNNGNGQCNVPAGLSNVVAVAAGQSHSLALKSDGTAVGWGWNAYGQTNVPPDSNIVAIAAGGYHSLAMISSSDPTIVRQPAPLYTNVTGRVLLSVGAVSSQPLNFQWLTNGTPISGATNWWLDLPKPITNASGNYSVIVSNALGVLVSSNAAVSVLSRPPFFLTQPVSSTNFGGVALTLSATAGGSSPLTYQWSKDGAAVFKATNSSWNFTPLTRSNSGVYSIVVSNDFGFTMSSNAVLRVLVPQQLQPPVLGADGTMTLVFGDRDNHPLTAADVAHFTAYASTNLIDWSALPGALVLTNGKVWLQDCAATNCPVRFYRVIENP